MSGISGKNLNQAPITIGKYDTGTFDLSDDVTINKKATVKTKTEALNLAKANPGAEFIVEKNDPKQGLSYDIYNLSINDKGEKIHKLQDVQNLSLFEKPLNLIEKKTNTSNSIKGFIVAENGEVSKPIYNNQFNKTNYEKLRNNLGLDTSKTWFKFVDKMMGMSAPTDSLPIIDDKELKNLESHVKKGDMILCGVDGSFIHGIVYVGKDAKLQEQLEQKWGMPKGSLKNEAIIMHSLQSDSDKQGTIDGHKEILKAGGTGVIVDTLERYTQRHDRDVMVVASVKNATDSDRDSVIQTAKSFVGKPYDQAFNTFDDERMYCTEFLMKSWENSSNPQKFETQKNPLISYPQFILDKLPDKVAKSMQDGGILHQEMVMTDGIATSPSVDIVWTSKNADKSEFFKKHERWADGIAGKVNDGYKKMLVENVPDEAGKSSELVNKIKELSARTRSEVK